MQPQSPPHVCHCCKGEVSAPRGALQGAVEPAPGLEERRTPVWCQGLRWVRVSSQRLGQDPCLCVLHSCWGDWGKGGSDGW